MHITSIVSSHMYIYMYEYCLEHKRRRRSRIQMNSSNKERREKEMESLDDFLEQFVWAYERRVITISITT